MHYLGLGKTLFNSSACLITSNGHRPQIELVLSERVNRNKASGVWPEQALRSILPQLTGTRPAIAENRDVITPAQHEAILDRAFPFYEHLGTRSLAPFSSRNPEIRFVTHHRCHAMAALAMSPFRKSIILVIDGAGTRASDFNPEHPEAGIHLPKQTDGGSHALEACSVYLQEAGTLRCVEKFWQHFKPSTRAPGHHFSEGLGTLYEKSAEYIFACKRSAGKVMGLAGFGRPHEIGDRRAFLEELHWNRAFQGKGKREWEACAEFELFTNLAASVQGHFEQSLLSLGRRLRETYPDFENLIFTGGCALNCTANMKLVKNGFFSEIYVPPFPGDESIGLGAASSLYHSDPANVWEPFCHENQQGYFGPRSSIPADETVENVFVGFDVSRPTSITEHCAQLLEEGKVIGWFQGRSESGPRALGNRSILARPDRPGLKDHLNRSIKFRESFRPYGCSCTHDVSHRYFNITPGFNAPYMSFAATTRPQYQEMLKEVTHVDGTSRMQTVRPGQNPLFHELLQAFGRRTGLFCLLNTSLNVMGEPIVETVLDARKFLSETPVDGMAIGAFYIRKQG
ncbi:MAG: hypothetical protein A2X94_07985 [Bdellovibrionales bacterium GWB1_55_8]|nr:MAG: hypothetical protein A2X94_07985 [Bdellovibrionales bacterium GWB1_55_8]